MLPEDPLSSESSPSEMARFAELEALYAEIVNTKPPRLRAQLLKWQTAKHLRKYCRHWETIALVIGSPLAAAATLFFAAMLFLPRTIHYEFADQQNCVTSPVILPGLFKFDSSNTFRLSHKPLVSIGRTAIFAYRLCAAPARNPLASASYINHQWIPLGGLHLGKTIKVVTARYPLASAGSLGTKAIPLQKPLVFTLNQTDVTFDYAVVANGQTSPCFRQKTVLSCSLTPLKLGYAKSYQAELVREFRGQKVGTVLSKNLQTITATAITQTSIGSGATVYDQPQQITINTDKIITKLGAVSLTAKNAAGAVTNVPITSSFKKQTITVNIASPLARKLVFDLHIDNLTSIDDSTLEQPYDLTFTTSGGPQAVGDNIPSYGLNSGQAMAVSFSQAVDPAQDPNQFASLLVNGAKQPAAITLKGQQLTIIPANGYPVCASVTVQLTAAARNIYGVSGDSAWSYTSRSHCYTTYSIGTSVQGRPITAYQFGGGPSLVLYVAAMEGNEQNSAKLLAQWIPNIDANPGRLPSYRTIVVIPQINPDGYAANTRLNAAGIDLNRNFPANNWQTSVTEPLANTVWTNDGGPYPLSAPESQALADFQLAHHPRLALTMHSHAGLVEANDAGDSDALGAIYAAKAGYRAVPTYAIGSIFNYTTTGAYEDWVHDKLGLPVLEVELESPTAVEYSRNLPALWAMAQISP